MEYIYNQRRRRVEGASAARVGSLTIVRLAAATLSHNICLACISFDDTNGANLARVKR